MQNTALSSVATVEALHIYIDWKLLTSCDHVTILYNTCVRLQHKLKVNLCCNLTHILYNIVT